MLENEQQKRWDVVVMDWRELVVNKALSDFKGFMRKEIIYGSDEEMKESLFLEQKELERRRKAFTESFSELKPPRASMDQIYAWNEAMDNLYKDIGDVHNWNNMLGWSTVSSLSHFSRSC